MGTDASPGAARLEEIVDGVFAWVQPDGSWWINNAGAITAVGDDGTHPGGTVVVDTCATHERTRRFLDALAAATAAAPIAMAVNTHQHGDHTYGNCLLPRETVIVGHEAMRAGLLADTIIDGCPPAWTPVPDWGPVTRRVPSIAVHDAVTLYAGTRRDRGPPPRLRRPHRRRRRRLAARGACAVHRRPDLPRADPARVHGFGRRGTALARVAGRRSTPPISCPAMARSPTRRRSPTCSTPTTATTASSSQTAADGRRDGLTPLDAATRCDLGEFAEWADAERLVLNLHRAYADADGGEFDLLAAMHRRHRRSTAAR